MLNPNIPEQRDGIEYLNFLVKTYLGLNKLITSTKNRLHQLNFDKPAKLEPILVGDDDSRGMESIKGGIARRIEKELGYFSVWTHWLDLVPGIGPAIAGGLVLLYYYKFTPSCPWCGQELIKQDGTFWCMVCEKSPKGEGNTTYRINVRDFPTISKWWAFLGMHCNADGVKPRRKKGELSNWSSRGRALAWQASASFVKGRSLYREVYDAIKEDKVRKRPELSKGHRNNQAMNETAKIFLSHFWTVARTLDGLPVSEPYVQKILGHSNITQPFYFDPNYEPPPKGRKKKETGQGVEARA